MLFKGTLDRKVNLRKIEGITEDYILQRTRKQLCGTMDFETKKEIVWISGVDFAHLESDRYASHNADGSVDVLVRFDAVMRQIYSGEEMEGIVVRKNEGERAIASVENVNVVIEYSETDGLIRVKDRVKVKVRHVRYHTMPNGRVGIEARGEIVYK